MTAAKPLVAIIRAADWMGSEWSEDAIKLGLCEAGLEAGRDYEVKVTSAPGDLATLPDLIEPGSRTCGAMNCWMMPPRP